MKLISVFGTVLLVSVIVLGLISYTSDLQGNYGTNIDMTSLDNTTTSLSKYINTSTELSTQVTNFTLEYGALGAVFEVPYKLTQIAWSAGRTIFTSWGVVNSMATDVGTGISEQGIPLPNWLIPTIIALIVITLVVIIIYAFFKWKFED